jgi:hypothetical protein
MTGRRAGRQGWNGTTLRRLDLLTEARRAGSGAAAAPAERDD